MGNALTAQYACSDLSDPTQQQDVPTDVIFAPLVPLFSFTPTNLFSTSNTLFVIAWGLLVGFVWINYSAFPQYFGNSWTYPNKELWIAILFGFLYYYLFMVLIVYLPFRPAGCAYALSNVQKLLDPTIGPPVPAGQRRLYEKLRAYKLSLGQPVPPPPLFFEP